MSILWWTTWGWFAFPCPTLTSLSSLKAWFLRKAWRVLADQLDERLAHSRCLRALPASSHLRECSFPLRWIRWVILSWVFTWSTKHMHQRAQMNRTMLPMMTGHYASGTSSYTVLQYAQGVKHSEFSLWKLDKIFPTETFRGFDWGTREKNIQHHGTIEPPQYDLSKVNTKVTLHENGSWCIDSQDCSFLGRQRLAGSQGGSLQDLDQGWDLSDIK